MAGTQFANYSFSISTKQQADWQRFLRSLPEAAQRNPVWLFLHDLSYTQDYTVDHPKFPLAAAAKSGK